MRPYQVGTAVAIVVIAAIATFDSRGVFAAHAGSQPGDVGPSWYPFWSATLMGLAAAFVGFRAATTPQPREGVFATRQSVTSVLKLAIPMFAYAYALGWLGFYIGTAVYMGFFAIYLGRYRWWAAAASALATPLAIYLLFEVAFKLVLPKSFLYTRVPGFPF